MSDSTKYNKILDALQELMEDKNIQTISVSEIALTAGVGKGSIYYYFPSKEAIWEALVERNYEKPLEIAQNLSTQTDVFSFYENGHDLSGLPEFLLRIFRKKQPHGSSEYGRKFFYPSEIPDPPDHRAEASALQRSSARVSKADRSIFLILPPWPRSC